MPHLDRRTLHHAPDKKGQRIEKVPASPRQIGRGRFGTGGRTRSGTGGRSHFGIPGEQGSKPAVWGSTPEPTRL